MKSIIALLAFTLLLAACNNGPKGVRVVNGGTSAIPAKEGEKISNFGENKIKASIVGKTFQYTRSDGNGFVTYNANGTTSFQDDQKGEGMGRWSAQGDSFCESFFDANGQPECGVFKNTGDAFFAAKSRLVELKV